MKFLEKRFAKCKERLKNDTRGNDLDVFPRLLKITRPSLDLTAQLSKEIERLRGDSLLLQNNLYHCCKPWKRNVFGSTLPATVELRNQFYCLLISKNVELRAVFLSSFSLLLSVYPLAPRGLYSIEIIVRKLTSE